MKARLDEEQIVRHVDTFTVAFILFFIVLSFGYVFSVYFPIGAETLKAKNVVTDEMKLPACCVDKEKLVKQNDGKNSNVLPEQNDSND